MNSRGLFIGVDKYIAPEVNELSCSVNDAKALYSLFSDTLGADNAKVLDNERATKKAVLKEIQALSSAGADDFVVISFSGHGSDDHALVLYDSDPYNFEDTSISLNLLVELFSQIPSKNILLLLDCCFSGGAGAKVFHREIQKRGIESTEAILNKIGGKGRVIFTASGPDQEAIENRKKGHGIFTFHVAEALQGPKEVISEGKISIYSFLDYVTKRVVDSAAVFRYEQHPTFRGTIDGEILLPLFKKGNIYETNFPEHKKFSITTAISDLLQFGLPKEVVGIWEGDIGTLNDLQVQAINEYDLLDGTHMVVSAPTSSGKTMVAEIAAVKAFFDQQKSCFLFPLRALVNDKYEEFTRKYSDFGIRIIRATGEISDDIPQLMSGKYDICLLTYEKFSNLLLGNPHLLNNVGLVLVDEAQMLADASRGMNLEFLLTVLRSQRAIGIEPQLLLLSAVIGNTNGLERWLDAGLLFTSKRPVPLDEGIILPDGTYRYLDPEGKEHSERAFISPVYRKGSSQDYIIPLVARLVGEGEKVLIFRAIKGETRGAANYLAQNLRLPSAQSAIDQLPRGDPSVSSNRLRSCLQGGIAFHNSDLDRDERRIIEEEFRNPESNLRVLVATTTLAMGVNTPAASVIMAGLMHPGNNPYSVAEYKNMVGRAGRLGQTSKGKSFLIPSSLGEAHQLWPNYVLGSPESLQSRFGDGDIMTVIVRVLASSAVTKSGGMTIDQIDGFLSNTFAAYQKKLIAPRNQVVSAIGEMQRNELVEEELGRFHLTPLGQLGGEMGLEVRSIVRLSSALSGLPPAGISEAALIAAVQATVELDNVYFPQNKRSVKERGRWRQMLRVYMVPRQVTATMDRNVKDTAEATARYKKACSTLLWISGNDIANIEQELLQHCRDSDAAGSIRSAASRTRDLIPAAIRVAEISHNDEIDLSTILDNLLIRLELGVSNVVVGLAKVFGNVLTRSDYKNLEMAGLAEFKSFEKIEREQLSQVLSNTERVEHVLKRIRTHKEKRIRGLGSLIED